MERMNWILFLKGIGILLIGQALTFVQLQGQFKFEWIKNNTLLVACMGIPISFLWMNSVKYLVQSFQGNMWPARLVSFAGGIIVFTLMTKWWFNEAVAPKTVVSLTLACIIVALQITWK